jgi:hypothetical protein
MNERIKELLEQAGVKYVTMPKDTVYEKFAELIVRECLDMCKTTVGNADYNTGRLHCLNNIKEHFGVEE